MPSFDVVFANRSLVARVLTRSAALAKRTMPERPLFSESFNFDRFQLPFFGRSSGYNGDGKLVVVSRRVAQLNVEVTVIGFTALVKEIEKKSLRPQRRGLGLRIGGLVGSVAPKAFTLIGDTGVLDLAPG